MKNLTIGKQFLILLIALAFVFSRCSSEAPTPPKGIDVKNDADSKVIDRIVLRKP